MPIDACRTHCRSPQNSRTSMESPFPKINLGNSQSFSRAVSRAKRKQNGKLATLFGQQKSDLAPDLLQQKGSQMANWLTYLGSQLVADRRIGSTLAFGPSADATLASCVPPHGINQGCITLKPYESAITVIDVNTQPKAKSKQNGKLAAQNRQLNLSKTANWLPKTGSKTAALHLLLPLHLQKREERTSSDRLKTRARDRLRPTS